MKTLLPRIVLAITGTILMSGLMMLPAMAQEGPSEVQQARMAERHAEMQQHREELREKNPEAAARMEERRTKMAQRREAFLENNPEAAVQMEERRERFRIGERPPRAEGRRAPGGPGFRGPRAGARNGDKTSDVSEE